MKLLNRLTIKHLCMNKKRTIVTIIGITLSTALMVGIGLLVSTFVTAMREDAIKYSGSHHAYFDSLSEEEKNELSLNVNFSLHYSYGVLGFSNVSSSNKYKPYVYVVSAEKEYLNHEELIEGRMPENDKEIVIPTHLATNGNVNFHIGDEIKLDIGYRLIGGEKVYNNNVSFVSFYNDAYEFMADETLVPLTTKTFEVVGIVNRSRMEDYSSPGYMLFTTNSEDIQEYRMYVNYKDVNKAFEKTDEICSKLSKNVTCSPNSSLLYYYGVSKYSNVNRSIVVVLSIALFLLSVGAIIVIYNSFAISAMERKKSFGLLSSLGATPKQIKYTVFFEAFIVGFLGITIGILGAFLGIYIVVLILNYLIGEFYGVDLKFVVEPLFVFIPIVFMTFVVYMSALIPARRSSKVSAIEMIRENDEIKIPRRKVKTPKWVRKFFGMEGEIALKNMKRNKRKYRITLLAIFVSIVLFISFSTYLKLGVSITDLNDLPDYDIGVSAYNYETAQEIASQENIRESHIVRISSAPYKTKDASYYQKNYYNFYQERTSDMSISYTNFYIFSDKDYNDMVNFTKAKRGDILYLNQANYVLYSSDNRKSYQTPIFVKNVSSLSFCSVSKTSSECKEYNVHLVENILDSISSFGIDLNEPSAIISESMAHNMECLSNSPNYFVSIFSDDYKSLYDKLSKRYENSNDVYVYSPKIEMKERQNSLLAIKILLYGFISLVTLTGVTSIFNTIYTSIHLRRKEFAMLRSVGLSPKGFNKMIFFESFFFGLKSLFYALPVSFFFVYIINMSIGDVFSFGTLVIPWGAVLASVFGVFIIVLLTMGYSVRKIKKENILNSLRDENI